MIGPRTFSTGDPLYAATAPRRTSLELRGAEQNIARLQSWGAVSLKQYPQPRRDQRQWVSDVARKMGLMVTAEGATRRVQPQDDHGRPDRLGASDELHAALR